MKQLYFILAGLILSGIQGPTTELFSEIRECYALRRAGMEAGIESALAVLTEERASLAKVVTNGGDIPSSATLIQSAQRAVFKTFNELKAELPESRFPMMQPLPVPSGLGSSYSVPSVSSTSSTFPGGTISISTSCTSVPVPNPKDLRPGSSESAQASTAPKAAPAPTSFVPVFTIPVAPTSEIRPNNPANLRSLVPKLPSLQDPADLRLRIQIPQVLSGVEYIIYILGKHLDSLSSTKIRRWDNVLPEIPEWLGAQAAAQDPATQALVSHMIEEVIEPLEKILQDIPTNLARSTSTIDRVLRRG